MDMNPFNLRVPEDADPAEALRPLDWAALLARLAAERDLRREFSGVGAVRGVAADFMNGAAQVVGDSSHAAQSVNPDTLANLKSTGGITVAAQAKACVAKLGARGKQ